MTAAKFRALAIGVIAVATAAMGAGCNLEPSAVSKPTYEADVRPIFMSRCIRCHGSPGLSDQGPQPSPTAPGTVRFDVFADTNCATDAGGAACVHGAAYEAMTGKFSTFLVMYAGTPLEMPPPPAPGLTSYQRDTILVWENEAANGGTPLEK